MSVREALVAKFGDLDTWQTRAALSLAAQVDSGDGVAGATRELRALVAQIEDSKPQLMTGAAGVVVGLNSKRATG